MNGNQLIKKHQVNKFDVMFSPNISSKEDGENYTQFFKYALIKFDPCVDSIENTYDGLSEDSELTKIWGIFQTKLSQNNIDVPDTVSKLFENCRFKIPTDTLPYTGDKNGKVEDSNNNEKWMMF